MRMLYAPETPRRYPRGKQFRAMHEQLRRDVADQAVNQFEDKQERRQQRSAQFQATGDL
jgi:hypothetical protein